MTREEFEKMSFEELMEWANENLDEVTVKDTLKNFAIDNIESEHYYLATHVLNALSENPYDTQWYLYDYSMGTLEEPTPITEKADIEHLIDFEEEE